MARLLQAARIVFHTEIRYFPDMKTRFARFSSLLFLLGSLTGLAAADAPFAGGKWIDLTHEFSSETLYWPTAERFALEVEFHGQTPKGRSEERRVGKECRSRWSP